MNYFDLIFVKDVRFLSKFIFFYMCMSSCSSTGFWKDCIFSIVLLPLFLVKGHFWLHLCGVYFCSLFCSIDIFVYSFVKTMLYWLLLLYSESWSWVVSVLWLCSPSILCWLLWFFFLCIWTPASICWYTQNNLLGFWWGLHEIYRSIW